MKTRLLLLTLLLIFTGSQCFGQARRVTRGKARTTTTTSRPSAKMISAFNELFENRYFFNYEANDTECDVVFKKANSAGNGSGLIVTPVSGQSQSFSYNITANGSVYMKIDGIKMNKEKLTWNLTPEGFIIENMFFQLETNPQKYNELINWDKENTEEEEMSTNDNVPDASTSNDNDNNKVYETVDQEPSFPGSINAWLAENIKYPVVAAENGVQGRVVVSFIVERDGSVSGVRVVRGVDPSLDKEAMRVVSCMPKWIPGRIGGEPVRTIFTAPVTFRLQ